jgi:hypothetical protein
MVLRPHGRALSVLTVLARAREARWGALARLAVGAVGALALAGCCCGPPRVRLGSRGPCSGGGFGLARRIPGFGAKRVPSGSPGGKLCKAWAGDPTRPATSGFACLPSGVCSCGWGADEGTARGATGLPNRIEFSVDTDVKGRINTAFVLADVHAPTDAARVLSRLERDAAVMWAQRHVGATLPTDAATAIRTASPASHRTGQWVVERLVFPSTGGYRVVFRISR